MFEFWRRRKKIWDMGFRSDQSLMQIADVLGLSDPSHDRENYWEWVIGEHRGRHVDITRTHRAGSIKCGQWIYKTGNDFDMVIVEKFPAAIR